VKLLRFFDWRFLLCLTLVVFAFGLVFAFVAQAQDSRAKDVQADRRAAQIDRLIETGRTKDAEAARERATLLAGQHEVQTKLNSLIAYFSRNGTYIPPYLLDNDSNNDNGDSDNNDGSSSHQPSKGGSGKQLPPKSGSTSQSKSNSPSKSRGSSKAAKGHKQSSKGSHSKAHHKAKKHSKSKKH
jgi:hypothetical protein